MRIRTTPAILGLVIALAACGDDATSSPPDANPPPDAAPPQPQLSISIAPESVVAGGEVTLTVDLDNFTLVDPTANPPPQPAPGEGHCHIYFDDNPNYAAFWQPVVNIATEEGDDGTHAVRVVLVTSAHEEVTPVVEDTASFTVTPN